ncbi:MAG: DNA-binding CsgD family transcriptional regulator [Candidatus Azotimanducaceae bacterium]|jgi:DNA-binding CsgD family transcriptional regulator
MATEPDALLWLLEFFSDNTHFHGAALTIHNTKTLDPIKRFSTGVLKDSQYVHEYKNDEIYKFDIWSQALTKLNKQACFVADHQAVTRKELEKSKLKWLIDRYDICSATAACWHLPENQTLRISFQKNTTDGQFKEDEMSFLNSLAVHIGRAIEISLKLSANNAHQSLDDHIDGSDRCIALISTTARVCKLNTAFEIFVSRQKSIVVSSNTLRFKDVSLQQHFELLLAQTKFDVLTMKKDYTFIIPSGDDDADYHATLVPIRNSQGEYQLLMTISPVSIRLSDKFEQLLMQTALTPSELDVIYKLSKNLTPNDIAKTKNRSVHTIRTQIKTIQRKLGVNTQAAAISKIYQL